MNEALNRLAARLEHVRREMLEWSASVGDLPPGVTSKLDDIVRDIKDEAKLAVDETAFTDDEIETIRDALNSAVSYTDDNESAGARKVRGSVSEALDILGRAGILAAKSTPMSTNRRRQVPSRFNRTELAYNLCNRLRAVTYPQVHEVHVGSGDGKTYLFYSASATYTKAELDQIDVNINDIIKSLR